MSDEEIEKMFRQKLESYEDTPSAKAWANISKELQAKNRAGGKTPRIWMVAASLILLVSVGLLLMPGKPPLKLQASQVAEPEPPQRKEQPKVRAAQPHESKSVIFLQRLASIRIESDKHADDYKARGRAISGNIAHIAKVQAPEVQTTSLVTDVSHGDTPKVQIAKKLEVEIPASQPVLALAEPEHEELSHSKEKIKSLGDIVNFVVRQVDPRKEKIIEFTNHDEGSSVSSINLGLLKIRTKQNDAKLN